jgi:hypothetical protein
LPKGAKNDVLAADKFHNLLENFKICVEVLNEKYSKLLVESFFLINSV